MSTIYHKVFFSPLYNIFVLLFKIFPWADAGIIVILLTVLARLIIFPLSRKAVVTQIKMNEITPELNKLKEKYKDNAEELARKTLAIYREKKVNPFSGILVILIQVPILIAIYRIFLHADFPTIDTSLLYSFIHAPDTINTTFLGFLDITQKSVLLSLLAAFTTFFQLRLSMKNQANSQGNSFGDNLARSMQMQMKYFFPILVFFISYKISGVVALYWLTTNLFSIAQEKYIRRQVAQTTQA